MAGRILKGNAIRDRILADLGGEIARLAEQGVRPGLAAVLVGNDPASRIYVGNKIEACRRIGLFRKRSVCPQNRRPKRFWPSRPS